MTPHSSRATTFRALYKGLIGSAGFSYATILLLQLKVGWGMWRFRDLTAGDTSSYFVNAHQWFQKGAAPISWSPLYTSFYAFLLNLSSDAFFVTILHRYLIILTLAILVLALMRRMMPPDLAWFMAAWWVILPINFNAMYEVHLFAVIPVVCAALVILGKRTHWCHGTALAILLAASVLVRNEVLLAVVVLAAAMLLAAARSRTAGGAPPKTVLRLFLAYGLPLAGACLVMLLYYRHASDAGALSAVLERKHTLNICQTFAYGYEQRHADFNKSPWTECQELMVRVFGKPEPSLMEAFRRNPQAIGEHFLWNIKLIPSGLEVALFNVTSSRVTPDYAPVLTTKIAWALSCILLAILAAGLVRLMQTRDYWWSQWLKERVWGWLLLAAIGCVTAVVMITQRPRPSYMFGLAILIRAATGMLLFVLLGESLWRRRIAMAFPAMAALLVILTPGFYPLAYKLRPQSLLKSYERLVEFAPLLERPGAVLVSPGFSGELCNYVGKGICQGLSYVDLRAEVSAGSSWPTVLDRHAATMVYIDELVLAEPAGQRLVMEAVSSSWQMLVHHYGSGQDWLLLARPGTVAGESPEAFHVGPGVRPWSMTGMDVTGIVEYEH
jgi:hypothetical protein